MTNSEVSFAHMKIAVLGCGLVGGAIARELAKGGHDVLAVDLDRDRLEAVRAFGVDTALAELDPATVRAFAERAELVVGALPGFMGEEAVLAALDGGRPVVDISFFPEGPERIDQAARSRGVTCLYDCGVAPGLGNLVLGRAEAMLESVDSFRCLVGGLPSLREPPWEYKAPFSPVDVLEEYTRPARLRRDGRLVTLPAMSEIETVGLPGVGTLEAFNTDGLRSLLTSSRAASLVEKTLRYPGHAAKIRALRDAGMFAEEPVRSADGTACSPRRVVETVLADAWRLDDAEDLTAMRIEIEGRRNGRPWRRRWDLLDRPDPRTRVSSMARTTGYTCTAMVELVARGLWTEVGAFAPEAVGAREGCYRAALRYLAERGIGFEVERN